MGAEPVLLYNNLLLDDPDALRFGLQTKSRGRQRQRPSRAAGHGRGFAAASATAAASIAAVAVASAICAGVCGCALCCNCGSCGSCSGSNVGRGRYRSGFLGFCCFGSWFPGLRMRAPPQGLICESGSRLGLGQSGSGLANQWSTLYLRITTLAAASLDCPLVPPGARRCGVSPPCRVLRSAS